MIVKLFKKVFINFLKDLLTKYQDVIVNEAVSKLDETAEYTRKYIVERAYLDMVAKIIKKIEEV